MPPTNPCKENQYSTWVVFFTMVVLAISKKCTLILLDGFNIIQNCKLRGHIQTRILITFSWSGVDNNEVNFDAESKTKSKFATMFVANFDNPLNKTMDRCGCHNSIPRSPVNHQPVWPLTVTKSLIPNCICFSRSLI